ncbi:Amino acid permease-like protein 4 [Sarcoptes scabiei]|uniref:Amino acid permease-like protein 4 n=1 Tax=Sarcoptes scabiei TaxID=52283 RepID=A0A132AES8_SARSC|nr:Amino acid permease-like protein 4 [Sarcoptes scabiei]
MDDQLETNAFEESDPLFENNGTKKPNSSLDTAEQDEAPHKNKHLCVHYENENECENVIDDTGENWTVRSNSLHGTNYDTKNLKSFKNYTRDALPRMEYYRNLMSILRGNFGNQHRPTLDELHGNQISISFDDHDKNVSHNIISNGLNQSKVVKFGWIKGVLVRNLLNIWGVILFLRLSWVAAHAGIIHGTLIILLASTCTTLTAMSMAAICTNGEVKGGGTYYMISRSLGPEFGGAIGIIFSLANAVAVAMYTVGFAETLRDLFWNDPDFDDINLVRLISCITVIILLIIVFIGTAWEAKVSDFSNLSLYLDSIFDEISSQFVCEIPFQIFHLLTVTLIENNLAPDYRDGHSFFSVFSTYFPAATGILAGANISGDLKNPSRAIPLGTFLAIGITTITYLLFHFIMAANVLRDANGMIDLVRDNRTHQIVTDSIQNCQNFTCSYGLMHYTQIVELMSWYGPLIYAGIFAAALSSALASLVSAPKVFQALCNDRLFPYISYFGKGYGPNNDPRLGYCLTFLIAFCCCLLGELNIIAPIISNFFLAAYTLINFSCFHASFSKSPGFRPSFRFYNQWLSLGSAFLMTIVMFITNWISALLTFLIILILYMYILYRKPDVNWGSSTQAQTFRSTLTSVLRLNLVPDHVKNYRPQILFLSGQPKDRPDHIDLAYLITKNCGLLICGIVVTDPISIRNQYKLQNDSNQWLIEKKIKAFVDVVQEQSFEKGVRALIQLSGIGKLRPNIIMIGFKHDWNRCDPKSLLEYFSTIHAVFDHHLSIVIFHDNSSNKAYSDTNSKTAKEFETNEKIEKNQESKNPDTIAFKTDEPEQIEYNPQTRIFFSKQKKGSYIDVWWMYDDGGLTLLLPYLVRSHPHWNNCKLRVFALANKQTELDTEQRNMATLLSKFRIDYSSVILIKDILKPPKVQSQIEFQKLIKPYLIESDSSENQDQNQDEIKNKQMNLSISKEDLEQFKDKNNRNIRLRELLIEHSMESRLIVMTLPVPRKDTCPPILYMAWLDTLTRDMPPMMLIRGNQTNVLTFYS